MIEYGELTKKAMADLKATGVCEDDCEDEVEKKILKDTAYAYKLDQRNVILEGVQKRLKALGIHYEDSDISSICQELNKRYIAIGIENGVPRAVKNWIRLGKSPNDAPAYRENLYELCMALQMSLEETRDFFKRFYMTIPFIYKNRVDAAYYYGLRNGKTYLEIRRILNVVDDSFEKWEETNEATDRVIMGIDAIDDDDLFVEYLRNHTFPKEKQFMTARAVIDELEESIAGIIDGFEEEERKEKEEINRIKDENEKKERKSDLLGHHSIRNSDGTINHKKLVYYLTGHNFQELDENKKRILKITKCEKLPKRFKENFPIDQIFALIHKGLASADQYRKALVLLVFYDYFEKQKQFLLKSGLTLIDYENRSQDMCEEGFEEYITETNKRLIICGLPPLYARHPFDWLILYCAHFSDPLYVFSEMLESHLSNDE